MSNLRIKFVYDDDPACALHTPNGNPLPGPESEYTGNEYHVPIDSAYPNGPRRIMPYDEYCRTYGNPDRHVVIGAVAERECPACHGWIVAGSLWGIDLMDDDPALRAVRLSYPNCRPTYYTPADVTPAWGYLADVARDLFTEAETE